MIKHKFTLEVCVDSVASAMAAEAGGATRLELCSNLIIGGTTPSIALLEQVKEACSIPIHVLIRPRFGDFLYDVYEFREMRSQILLFGEKGADGVVIGMLKKDGSLDIERLKALREAAGDKKVTLHRAFDMCKDPFQSMEEAIAMDFHTILTSGQQDQALAGIDLLDKLQQQNRGRIELQAGGGIKAEVIQRLYTQTGITAYHMSGKEVLDSEMLYRKEQVHMGIPGFSEYELFRTSSQQVREARALIDTLI